MFEVGRASGIRKLEKNFDNIDSQEYEYAKDLPQHGFLGYYMKEQGFEVEQINDIFCSIRFVGLFDTVSSYDPGYIDRTEKRIASSPSIPASLGVTVAQVITKKLPEPKFNNDVGELNLNRVNALAQKLIHFTALDEHRKNFALTHINHSHDRSIELTLPGVHSDVGGGYMDNSTESVQITDYVKGASKKAKELTEQGWYNTNDSLTISWQHDLTGTRKNLSNKYSYIPLLLMYKFAQDFEKDMFRANLKDKFKIPVPAKTQEDSLRTKINERIIKPLLPDPAKNKSILLTEVEDMIVGKAHSYQKAKLKQSYPDLKVQHYMQDTYIDEEEALTFVNKKLNNYAFNKQGAMFYKTAQQILWDCGLDDRSGYAIKTIQQKLPDLINEIIDQIFLRVLRNRFLHWSARYNGLVDPHAPDPSGKRQHY